MSPCTKKQSIRPKELTRSTSTQTVWSCNNRLKENLAHSSQKNMAAPPITSTKSKFSERPKCTSPDCNRSLDRLKKDGSSKQPQIIQFKDELASASVRRSPSPGRRKIARNKTTKEQSGYALPKGSSKSKRENLSFLQTRKAPVLEMPSLFADASIIFLIL